MIAAAILGKVRPHVRIYRRGVFRSLSLFVVVSLCDPSRGLSRRLSHLAVMGRVEESMR